MTYSAPPAEDENSRRFSRSDPALTATRVLGMDDCWVCGFQSLRGYLCPVSAGERSERVQTAGKYYFQDRPVKPVPGVV
jgi:hypothetical protein